jgi:hypothetical protein
MCCWWVPTPTLGKLVDVRDQRAILTDGAAFTHMYSKRRERGAVGSTYHPIPSSSEELIVSRRLSLGASGVPPCIRRPATTSSANGAGSLSCGVI